MEISDNLLCLFSAQVERRDGSYVIEVPEQELRFGGLDEGETYRVTMLSGGGRQPAEPEPSVQRRERGDRQPVEPESSVQGRERSDPTPPIEEGETRIVEVEDIGDQGDGITRVERGFVVIVPETEQGERVTVEITDVRQNVAFADVVERHAYYE